jgi:flagella basal body P-ring formation protein FlgA
MSAMTRVAALVALFVLALPAAAQVVLPGEARAPRSIAPAPPAADLWDSAPCVWPQGCIDRVTISPFAPLVLEQADARPALKAEVTVLGEIVRIGDLVDNAGAVADVAIFRAPDLGQTGTVPANRVAEAVRPHNIASLDTRGIAEVVVTRASRAITGKDIEARLVRAVASQYGIADTASLTVTFDNDVRTMQVEPTGAELRITRLTFDSRGGRFDATFELPGSVAARRLPLRFTGLLAETFEAVVPTRPLVFGEVVKVSDLTVARRPKAEYAPTVLSQIELAVGLSARRSLRAGQVLRQGDLAKPDIVARNEAVTITYEVPGIVLSVRGQALEAGAEGSVISVLNAQSKRTILATVTSPGRVSVAAVNPRVANAARADAAGVR